MSKSRLSRRARLFVLSSPGAGIVFEKLDEDGERVPVKVAGGPFAARRWAEAHYERLEWESPHRATALVGILSPMPRQARPAGEFKPWELRPVTYATDDFRTYLPELLSGSKGPVIVQTCEEYVPESRRWEPFEAILWESTW